MGHFGDDFYRPDDQTNSVKALKETTLGHLDQALIPPEPLHHVTIIQLYGIRENKFATPGRQRVDNRIAR